MRETARVSVDAVTLFFALLAVAAQAAVAVLALLAVAGRASSGAARLREELLDAVAPQAMWLAFLVAAVATAGSLYLSEIADFPPCRLCWYQRAAMYPLVPVLAIAAHPGLAATNLFGHLLRLPLDYFEKRSVGGVLSRFLSVQSIQQTLTGGFIEGILDGLTVVLVLLLLVAYSPGMTLLVIGAFLLYSLLRWVSYRQLRQLKEEQLVHIARQQSHMIESIEGIQTIKLANRQAERRARMANATIEVANREAGINRIAATFSALAKLIFGLQRIALIWISSFCGSVQ